jgi:hypothetical protein
LRRLENHGRALRIEHEHETLRAGWAGATQMETNRPAVQRVCACTIGTAHGAHWHDQGGTGPAHWRD